MSGITTHILDTSAGRPASGVSVRLELDGPNGWKEIGAGSTDTDGRLRDLLDRDIEAGNYRLTFAVGEYFSRSVVECFFPEVTITFAVTAADEHYHVPLLVSPFGYSTYRGS
jgi:5-hydroxyisourate hydrolase